jgi:uncharacterized protein (DUF1697 family)
LGNQTYVALLYSIIIDKASRVKNDDLKLIAKSCGFGNIASYIASGNLIFTTQVKDVSRIEQAIESAFQDHYHKPVDIIVKCKMDFLALLQQNPWPNLANADGSRVFLKVMREPISEEVTKVILSAPDSKEKLSIINGNVWYFVPQENAGSSLHGKVSHRRNGVGTSRNWNTLSGLAKLLEC